MKWRKFLNQLRTCKLFKYDSVLSCFINNSFTCISEKASFSHTAQVLQSKHQFMLTIIDIDLLQIKMTGTEPNALHMSYCLDTHYFPSVPLNINSIEKHLLCNILLHFHQFLNKILFV
jgi:hypothetical protein